MYKPAVREEVRQLRTEGLTIREIREKMPFIAKGTVSAWIRGIFLAPEQQKRIVDKQLKGREIFVFWNERRRRNSEERMMRARQDAEQLVGRLSLRDLALIGTALFWAEGCKTKHNMVDFVNSDPRMIQLMMKFLREVLQVPDPRIRCRLTIHPGIDEKKTLAYWSEITSIPLVQFHKTYFKVPKGSQRKMHRKLYQGTLRIVVSDTYVRQRIEGLLQVIATMPLSSSPV